MDTEQEKKKDLCTLFSITTQGYFNYSVLAILSKKWRKSETMPTEVLNGDAERCERAGASLPLNKLP